MKARTYTMIGAIVGDIIGSAVLTNKDTDTAAAVAGAGENQGTNP